MRHRGPYPRGWFAFCNLLPYRLASHNSIRSVLSALFKLLSARNWEVHTDLEPSNMSHPSLESLISSSTFDTAEERDARILERIKEDSVHDHKKALLIKTSHIGGHKFAGNLIICFPTGASVWYGRVSPKEVSSSFNGRGCNGMMLITCYCRLALW